MSLKAIVIIYCRKFISLNKKETNMVNKKGQTAVTQMIQRCHKLRQKRKQLIDQARQTADEIERERLLQTAEHYCRIVNDEQTKIDSQRDPKEKNVSVDTNIDTNDIADTGDTTDTTNTGDNNDTTEEEETGFPDFIANLK